MVIGSSKSVDVFDVVMHLTATQVASGKIGFAFYMNLGKAVFSKKSTRKRFLKKCGFSLCGFNKHWLHVNVKLNRINVCAFLKKSVNVQTVV